jgi:hypothetical protein
MQFILVFTELIQWRTLQSLSQGVAESTAFTVPRNRVDVKRVVHNERARPQVVFMGQRPTGEHCYLCWVSPIDGFWYVERFTHVMCITSDGTRRLGAGMRPTSGLAGAMVHDHTTSSEAGSVHLITQCVPRKVTPTISG